MEAAKEIEWLHRQRVAELDLGEAVCTPSAVCTPAAAAATPATATATATTSTATSSATSSGRRGALTTIILFLIFAFMFAAALALVLLALFAAAVYVDGHGGAWPTALANLSRTFVLPSPPPLPPSLRLTTLLDSGGGFLDKAAAAVQGLCRSGNELLDVIRRAAKTRLYQ